jgi:hypothetical protein
LGPAAVRLAGARDSVGSNWAGAASAAAFDICSDCDGGGRWPDWLQAAALARSKANSGSERRTGSLLLVWY